MTSQLIQRVGLLCSRIPFFTRMKNEKLSSNGGFIVKVFFYFIYPDLFDIYYLPRDQAIVDCRFVNCLRYPPPCAFS